MAFQIKNFVSVIASMINHFRSTQSDVTDMHVGAIARTMLEAPAIEIDQLYQQMTNGLLDAIPVATYNSFNFSLLLADAASGIVRVTITPQGTDTLIPAGTVFSFTGGPTSYVSLTDTTIPAAGSFVDLLVSASTVGAATNLAASTDFTMTPTPAGFVSAANAAAFSNGSDTETEDQRKIRFIGYIQTLQRGTVAALKYGAKTAALFNADGIQTEAVKNANVIEPWIADDTQPIGLVNLYVHNGVGSTSSPLVTQAQTVIDGYTDAAGVLIPGWKAAGVKVVVIAASEVAINMAGVLTAAAGYDHDAVAVPVAAALEAYVLGLDLGQSFVFAEALFLVMSIPGVANFVFSTPTADQTATASQKLMPGTMAIT